MSSSGNESQDEGGASTIAGLAGRFAEPLTQRQTEQLDEYLRLLLEWNRTINLTGAASLVELVADHLPDSFALARLLGSSPGSLVDVGSGGGLPGIPTAILRPGLSITLSEPRSRRRAFLSQAVHRLGLPAVQVLGERAEALPAAGYAVAVARAVFAPAQWLAVGGRLVGAEGRVVVLVPAESDWTPPPGVQVLDEVRYSAGARNRLALACSVPRGTPGPERST